MQLPTTKATWWCGSGLGLGISDISFGDVVKGTRCEIEILRVVPAQQQKCSADNFITDQKDHMQRMCLIRMRKVWNEQ